MGKQRVVRGELKELKDGINALTTLYSSRRKRESPLGITRENIHFRDLGKLGSLACNRIHPLDKALGSDFDVSRIRLFCSRHLYTAQMLSIVGLNLCIVLPRIMYYYTSTTTCKCTHIIYT